MHMNFHAKNVCSIFGSRWAKIAPADSQLDFWRENYLKHYMKKRMTKIDYDHELSFSTNFETNNEICNS